MRIFWPTSGIPLAAGTAVGWRVADTYCVAAIVDHWLDDYAIDPKRPEAPVLEALATVKPAAQRAATSNGKSENGTANASVDEKTDKVINGHSTSAPGFTIWVAAGRPIATSSEAEIVLYKPSAKPSEALTLYDREGETPFMLANKSKKPAEADEAPKAHPAWSPPKEPMGQANLNAILARLNAAYDAQVRLGGRLSKIQKFKEKLPGPLVKALVILPVLRTGFKTYQAGKTIVNIPRQQATWGNEYGWALGMLPTSFSPDLLHSQVKPQTLAERIPAAVHLLGDKLAGAADHLPTTGDATADVALMTLPAGTLFALYQSGLSKRLTVGGKYPILGVAFLAIAYAAPLMAAKGFNIHAAEVQEDSWSLPAPISYAIRAMVFAKWWAMVIPMLWAWVLRPLGAHNVAYRIVRALSRERSCLVTKRHYTIRSHSALLNQVAQRAGQLVLIDKEKSIPLRAASFEWNMQIDQILGFCTAAALAAVPWNRSQFIYYVDPLLASPLMYAMAWLNTWPLGLKLNTPLSNWLCCKLSLFLSIVQGLALPLLVDVAPYALLALSVASVMGLTWSLALLSDLISLCTLHIRAVHFLTSNLLRWQLSAISGLWDLFRGKRRNVLRNRVDTGRHELDVLFLGTLLFTLSAFLAPTVLGYAALFAAVNGLIKLVQRGLAWIVALLDTLPFIELLARVVMPKRVPAGVNFDTAKPPKNVVPAVEATGAHPVKSTLEIKSTPTSFGAILGRWFRAASAAVNE